MLLEVEIEPCNLQLYNQLPDVCSYCQETYDESANGFRARTIDHIIPQHGHTATWRSRRLTFRHIDNLLQCCKRCNMLKGNKDLLEFRSKLMAYKPQWLKLTPKESMTMINSINVLLNNIN